MATTTKKQRGTIHKLGIPAHTPLQMEYDLLVYSDCISLPGYANDLAVLLDEATTSKQQVDILGCSNTHTNTYTCVCVCVCECVSTYALCSFWAYPHRNASLARAVAWRAGGGGQREFGYRNRHTHTHTERAVQGVK